MKPVRCVATVVLVLATASAQWRERFPLNVPSNRSEAAMTFDLAHGYTLLFGGGPTGSPFTMRSDTWSFDGSDWTLQSPPQSPTGRLGAGMVLDLARGMVVLYGGVTSFASTARPNDETWEWNGATWNRALPTTSPGGLAHFGFAYDLVRARCVLYGGTNNPGLLIDSNQTWEYDGITWTRVLTAANPGPLERPGMCYGGGRTLLFGGINVQTGGTNLTWSYNGTNWSQVAVGGTRPPVRTFGKMVWVATQGVAVLHGGMDPYNGTPLTDTWQFDGSAWTQFAPPTPSARTRFAMAYDELRGKVVLHGGVTTANQPLTDTHEFGAYAASLGTGCPGLFGMPQIAAAAPPRLGSVYSVALSNLAPSAVFAGMVVGLDVTSPTVPLPLNLTPFGMPNCTLYVRPDVTLFLPVLGGTATSSLSIPSLPALVGTNLYQQGMSLDAGANAAGIAWTSTQSAVVGL